MEVRLHRQDLAEFDLQAGFLLKLTSCRLFDWLVPFDVTTRDTPAVVPPTADKQSALLYDNNGDAYGRIAVLNPVAGGALPPVMILVNFRAERRCAVGTEGKKGRVHVDVPIGRWSGDAEEVWCLTSALV